MNSDHNTSSHWTILALASLIVASNPLQTIAGDFSVPATISREAQAALAQFSLAARNIPLPSPDDIAAWKKVQAEIEAKRAAANEAVIQLYQPEIQARKLAGVPVLDVKP